MENDKRYCLFNIIGEATIPKESFAAFGLSFYDIIVKPTLKMLQRSERVSADEEEIEMLKDASKRIFKTWLTAEENHTLKVRKQITEIIENRAWLSTDEWDRLLENEHGERLLRGRIINDRLGEKLSNIKLPNLILHLSNAPYHEIEQRIKYYNKSVGNEQKEREKNRIREILLNYIVPIELIKSGFTMRQSGNEFFDLETVIEEYTIKEVKIEDVISQIKNDVIDMVNKMVSEIIEKNEQVGENQDLRMAIVQGMLETFRQKIAAASKQDRENIEIAYDLNIPKLGRQSEEIKQANQVKKGPGRPKKEKKDDPSQIKIDTMFKHK